MRVDSTVTEVIPFLHAIDLMRHVSSAVSVSEVTSEPGSSGRWVLRMRTGMPRSTAGRSVLGCRTLAPK